MTTAAFAAAKVNLFLHVGAPAADGFHPICSLMAFADVGDVADRASQHGSDEQSGAKDAARVAGAIAGACCHKL